MRISFFMILLGIGLGVVWSSEALAEAKPVTVAWLTNCATPRAGTTGIVGSENCTTQDDASATDEDNTSGTVTTAAVTTGTGGATTGTTGVLGVTGTNQSCGTGRVLALNAQGSLSCRDLTWNEVLNRIPSASCGMGQNLVGLNAQGANCSQPMPVCGAGQVLKWAITGQNQDDASTTTGTATGGTAGVQNAAVNPGANQGATFQDNLEKAMTQNFRCVDLAPRVRVESAITKGHGINVGVYNHDYCALGVVSGTEKGDCIVEAVGANNNGRRSWKLTNRNAGYCSVVCFDFDQ